MFPSDPEGCLHASSSIAFVLRTGKLRSGGARRLPEPPATSVAEPGSRHTPAQDPGGHLLAAQLLETRSGSGGAGVTSPTPSLRTDGLSSSHAGRFKEQAPQNSCRHTAQTPPSAAGPDARLHITDLQAPSGLPSTAPPQASTGSEDTGERGRSRDGRPQAGRLEAASTLQKGEGGCGLAGTATLQASELEVLS